MKLAFSFLGFRENLILRSTYGITRFLFFNAFLCIFAISSKINKEFCATFEKFDFFKTAKLRGSTVGTNKVAARVRK